MTDLEITKLCAEAIGLSVKFVDKKPVVTVGGFDQWYDPLHDDAQAMALVKKFGLTIDPLEESSPFTWRVCIAINGDWEMPIHTEGSDLNRAICECVAKMTVTHG